MEAYHNQEYVPNVGEPTERITIHISCRNLADLDTFTVSDPVCHFFVADEQRPNQWRLYGKTEQIENNLNPDFVTHFEMDYYFEKEQRIKVEVYDVDLTELEHIGSIETSLGAIMGSMNTTLMGDLYLPNKAKPKSRGKIILRAEKVATSNDLVYFSINIRNLKSNKGWFCGSDDPFIYIERARSQSVDEFLKVIQTEPVRSNLNPSWHHLCYPAKELCNGNFECPIKFKVYSWRNSGYHKFYGEFETTIEQIRQGNHLFNLTKDGSVLESEFQFEGFYIEERPSFYDFLHSGWKMNLILAIDFTASNGEVTDPKSLHFINPSGRLNDYQSAILQVGNVLEPYSYNHRYTCYGFGGIPRYLGTNQVSHCFHLNGQENPEVDGVQGIMDAYQFSLFS